MASPARMDDPAPEWDAGSMAALLPTHPLHLQHYRGQLSRLNEQIIWHENCKVVPSAATYTAQSSEH